MNDFAEQLAWVSNQLASESMRDQDRLALLAVLQGRDVDGEASRRFVDSAVMPESLLTRILQRIDKAALDRDELLAFAAALQKARSAVRVGCEQCAEMQFTRANDILASSKSPGPVVNRLLRARDTYDFNVDQHTLSVACRNGSSMAILELARNVYLSGDSTGGDNDEFIRLVSAAESLGSAEAMTWIAMLEEGRGTRFESYSEDSVELMLRAAALGNPRALVVIASYAMRQFDESPDVMNIAVSLLRVAAEKGHAGAAYQLFAIYSGGYSYPPDPIASHRWLLEAASLGQREALMVLQRTAEEHR